jgi:hypothetical protein
MKSLLLITTGLLFATTALWPTTSRATDRETRQIFESYAQCVVKKHPEDAEDIVLSTMPSKDIIKHSTVIRPDCLEPGQQLVMPGGDFLRYGLAVALVRREFAGGLPADIAKAGPIPHFEPNESDYLPKPGKKANAKELARLAEQRSKAEAIRAMSIYGECVARADPAAALQLVLSNPATKEESQAFRAMGGALSSCLTQGQTITLDKESLRGALAMSLYRLAKAPRVPTTASKN